MSASEPASAIEIGIAELDDDHSKILKLLSEIAGTSGKITGVDSVIEIISKLKLVTEQHFKREESLMAAVGYKDHAVHKAMHDDEIGKLAAVLDDIRATAKFPRPEVITSLAIWFHDHTRTADMDLAEVLHRQGRS